MSYQLGDIVPLSVTITDENGDAADAESVTLTVTPPDGTTVSPGVTHPQTGTYNADYATTQEGRHGVRWVATGDNASAFTDVFDVEPADDQRFLSLADVKTHLKKTDTKDDAELAGFAAAACAKIVELIGPVSPVSVADTARVPDFGKTIVLGTSPVLGITMVTAQGPSPTTIPAADPATGTDGWVLHAGPGVLTHTRYWPRGAIQIDYRAGRTPVPGNIRLAGLELTAHLWRSIKLNGSGGRPPIQGADDIVTIGQAYALPNRVRELLGLGRNPTATVLVG